MNSAQLVVQKFGGQSALAGLIGKGQTTVQYWTKTGTVPAKWHSKLLRLAQEHGIDLAPGDLVAVEEPPASIPEARWHGVLQFGDLEVPCFVLSDERRVISRTGATLVLAGKQGGGQLERYLNVASISKYVPADLGDRMVEFSLPHIVNKKVKGLEAETFIEICRAYVQAFSDKAPLSAQQIDMVNKASMFLAACAKVGLIALIDEATGYQYDRAGDALQFKLKLYLEEEMRKWEKTFPEELWKEFARLTHWGGTIHLRPKYWGKLVMELVYGYLDRDVADWLRKNAPKPQKGQNYHQWLSSQYGLKKLIEHIWIVVGMSRCCKTMRELRDKMAETHGRMPLQFTVYLPPKRNEKMLPFMDVEPEEAPGQTGLIPDQE